MNVLDCLGTQSTLYTNAFGEVVIEPLDGVCGQCIQADRSQCWFDVKAGDQIELVESTVDS